MRNGFRGSLLAGMAGGQGRGLRATSATGGGVRPCPTLGISSPVVVGLGVTALIAVGCTGSSPRVAQAISAPGTGATASATALPALGVVPTAMASSTRPAIFDPEPVDSVQHVFSGIPDNEATGESAPDFTARLLGGEEFRLSSQRGASVFLFPTAIGCSDCLFALQEIASVYPEFRGRGLRVVILNLYPEDTPEAWRPYVDYLGEAELLWGVAGSTDFVVDYGIRSLGTSLLIDPEGRLVFRRSYPLFADELRQLFDFASQ